MGLFLTSYGDDAYHHEGYAAQVLDNGSLTSTYSDATTARMAGRLVAACGCGWTGSTQYPTQVPFDDAAQELALAEWEHSHARPTLDALRAVKWDQLCARVRELAASHCAITSPGLSALTPSARRELLDRTLGALNDAAELGHQLREPRASDHVDGGEGR
ncbi:MAG: hypothetical protein ACRDQ4_14080 [Pseudonocardiaceae bacterium]